MLLGLFFFLVANAAALLGAHAILRRAATGDAALDLVLFLVLRLLLVSIVVLAAGIVGALSPIPLGLAGGAALAILLLLGEHRRLPRLGRPQVGWVLAVLLAVIAARLLLQAWFFAPYNYDALSYHLTKVAEWVRAGGFTHEMGIDTHAPFPAGFELLEAWWVVFFHHDVLIEMAGVEFLLLAFAAVVALARQVGLGHRTAVFAGVIFVMTPGVHLSATSCLNDVPTAALLLATAALVLARAPLAWVVLVAGLGIGVKPTYGYALPGIALLGWLVRKEPARPPRAPRLAWAVGIAAVAVGLFWYGRNGLWYGNPIHPVGTAGLVGGTGELKIQFGPSLSSGFRNVRALLEARLYDNYIAYGPLLLHVSGWGSVGFGIGLLALVIELRRNAALRRLAGGLAASLGCVLFLVNHDPWFFRFVLFFPALLAISAAAVAARLRPVLVLAGAGLAFQFAATMVPVDLPVKHLRVLARAGWRERTMAEVFEAQAPADAVACLVREPVHYRGESYLLYGPDYSRRVVYLKGQTADAVRDEMERAGVRWLYATRETPARDPILEESVQGGLLQKAARRLYVRPGGRGSP